LGEQSKQSDGLPLQLWAITALLIRRGSAITPLDSFYAQKISINPDLWLYGYGCISKELLQGTISSM